MRIKVLFSVLVLFSLLASCNMPAGQVTVAQPSEVVPVSCRGNTTPFSGVDGRACLGPRPYLDGLLWGCYADFVLQRFRPRSHAGGVSIRHHEGRCLWAAKPPPRHPPKFQNRPRVAAEYRPARQRERGGCYETSAGFPGSGCRPVGVRGIPGKNFGILHCQR